MKNDSLRLLIWIFVQSFNNNKKKSGKNLFFKKGELFSKHPENQEKVFNNFFIFQ